MLVVDGDDWIDEDTVSICVQKFIEHPNMQCVLFSYIKEYPGNSIPVHVLDNSEHFERDLCNRKNL